ncbi:putative E3 ubiquitin-protein ligase XERICO [Sesamum alatum]|uniref:E3 ubiquitin-protein ligase XERICO n=1 Tax=Sesamum alatum TaxID=300844 RepID=A0AAE1YH77_9LAMI|nr:putative E3 ubiquitin-protein ligase XERICO [Sesamum alatum]
MLQLVPQWVVLNYVVAITLHLKWAWDYLLFYSFSHPTGRRLPEYVDDLNVTCYENDSESEECAVCLCKIDEGDEVRELRCDHLFHRACLDRWLGYGRMTCPLCRNNLRLPSATAELHQELILINFCAASRYSDCCAWWLR